MVNKINLGMIQHQNQIQAQVRNSKKSLSQNFEDLLVEKSSSSKLKFSKHAEQRLKTRNVEFTPRELSEIEDALDRADKKGVRETLILTDKTALIASARNKTVITTVSKEDLRQNIFTNIDGAVII